MRLPPGRRVALVTVIGILALTTRVTAGEANRNNSVGLEVLYAFPPAGDRDPYSGPLGLGVFYERHNLWAGLFAGAQLAGYGFYPLHGEFGDSFMLVPAVRLGYDFSFRIERRFALTLSPYLTAGMYWRDFLYATEEFDARRPILAGGLRVDVYAGERLLFGLSLDLILILDQTPLVSFGQGERLGVRF